jgi:hypothetical protein
VKKIRNWSSASEVDDAKALIYGFGRRAAPTINPQIGLGSWATTRFADTIGS